MAEANQDSIVLEQLRIMRNEVQAMRTGLETRLDRLETPVSSVEHMLGHIYATSADNRAATQELTRRVDS